MNSIRWSVTLDGRTVVVTAPDKFTATKEAAKAMKVRWSQRARDMVVTRLGSGKGGRV